MALFDEITHHLMVDEVPSVYLNQVSLAKEFMESPFQVLNRMKTTEQSKVHHPEGNVWIHTMMVVDEAAKRRQQSKNPTVFMWSALLHDIGKPDVTYMRKGKITAYDHDIVGAENVVKLLSEIGCDSSFIESVRVLVRWHMQILFVTKNMTYANIVRMQNEVDIDEVALLGLCDRLGRGNADHNEIEQVIDAFLEVVHDPEKRKRKKK